MLSAEGMDDEVSHQIQSDCFPSGLNAKDALSGPVVSKGRARLLALLQ